ncbi:LuxR family transcriptional regulator [Streptomyces kanamyceticus]|uniref:Helix-turn-helix transcriptional regulator n=1 Tax=Streptomyces kanamyceticus TaxID=1967 RepID=A0A5J6G9K5_STRKN|nr:LuxR family transcriptional regulator [Streptomyces kanamyceticus]QEU89906.1 helix-turn-helix transcriptional regulator [Streptomyces kanamyceticus]
MRAAPDELIARDDELSRLQRALTRAGSGRGGVVAITGPIASGKTALLDAGAAKSGFVALRAVCSWEERTLPYGMLGQLFDHPELAAQAPDLAHFTASCESPQAGTDNRLRAEFTRTLLALAADWPVLIGIDDVHHADAESLRCLLHLARRIGPARIAVVLTELRRPTPADSRFQAELLSLRSYQEIALRPLTEAQTGELVRRHLGAETHEDVSADTFRATGGNLLLGHGLINDIREARTAGRPGVVAGRAYRLAYLSSLYRCGPSALRVARASAVLGASAEAVLVQRMTGLNKDAVEQVYEQLNEGRLLQGERFPHPAARSIVLDDLSALERRNLHESALELLRDHGVAGNVLARHQIGAGRVHGEEAVELFTGAAREHHLRGELDDAAGYLELAHRASDDPVTRAALRVGAAAIERLCNPVRAGRHLPELLTASRAGLLSSEHAVSLADWLAMGGRPGEAAEVLATQRPAADSEQHRALLRSGELSLALVHPGAWDPLRRTDRFAAGGLGSLPGPARHRAVADQAVIAALRGRLDRADANAESVLQHTDATADRTTAIMALLALLYAENTDAVQFWVDKLAGDEGTRTPADEAVHAGFNAEIALRRGDLMRAVEYGEAALGHRHLPTWGMAAALPLSSTVVAAIRLGDLDRAERWLAEPLPQQTPESLFGLHLLWARGQHHLATGRHGAAYTAFRECGERMRRWAVDVPGLALWRVDAAESLLLLGRDRAEGLRLVSEQLSRPMRPRARVQTLRVQAAYSPPPQRIDLLEEAADLLVTCNDQYELANVLSDLAEASSMVRQHSRARGLLRRARHLATQCGAVPLLRRLGAEPSDIGGAWDATLGQRIASLTESERRVAALAAVGRTNREIAEQLFVTASTVEQHLTNVFRKLAVKGRQQLPKELADVGEPADRDRRCG